ncbi:MAG: hypothetical protein HOW97_33125 [Catenulispora sp.]|nr:hypothetical protein [Catenulispora sp.]
MSIPKRAAAAVAAAATALVLTACSSSGSTSGSSAGSSGGASTSTSAGASTPSAATTSTSDGSSAAVTSTSWDRNPDQASTAKKAGLPMLGNENLQVHYHAHLDVIVDGQKIPVPQYIGIDENAQTITALHTHDASGILHIESDKDTPFTLGQAFTEWGQPLSTTQVGPVAIGADKTVKLIVNGKEVSGDPAQYVLKAHDEVVVWVGAKDATPQVPSSYAFASGL